MSILYDNANAPLMPLTSYFIINQGEVEQISMMKPKAETENDEGMLEYLEDIVGSSRFKQPIEQLGADVEVLNEQRREKVNV